MNRTNCPNCGAIITGPVCEYCGTRFEAASAKLLQAKADALKAAKTSESLYTSAVEVMRKYRDSQENRRKYIERELRNAKYGIRSE